MAGESGSERLTADGVIGTSGKPLRIFCIAGSSGNGGVGQLVLRNGTSATGTIYISQSAGAAASPLETQIFDFGPRGLRFPGGCFFDKDTNMFAIVAEFSEEF